MKAVCIELKGEEGELDGTKFDVVTVSLSRPFIFYTYSHTLQSTMAFHHLPSIPTTTRILSSFLKPGGALIVCDFRRPSDYDPHNPPEGAEDLSKFKEMLPHVHGVTEEDMRAAFEGAGLVDIKIEHVSDAKAHGHASVIYVTRGFKPQ
jgi:hypothetical protein